MPSGLRGAHGPTAQDLAVAVSEARRGCAGKLTLERTTCNTMEEEEDQPLIIIYRDLLWR